METVFISSVIQGYEEYRQAAKEAVELMDRKPVMSENFGARPYPPGVACITEVEKSDIYLVILGQQYGYEMNEGISVTHAEFRAAKNTNRPILAFIQNCEMENKQNTFKKEVESYSGGVFRASFNSSAELKDQIIKALRQFEKSSNAITETEFISRVDKAIESLSDGWGSHPELVFAFQPQPDRMVDIVKMEDKLDSVFNEMREAGLVRFKDGYEPLETSDLTGISSGKCKTGYFANGLVTILIDPNINDGGFFPDHFVPPDTLIALSKGFCKLIKDNSGYVYIGLRVMDNAFVANPPDGNSMNMGFGGVSEKAFNRLFVPITQGTYDEWIHHCINQFKRTFKYR